MSAVGCFLQLSFGRPQELQNDKCNGEKMSQAELALWSNQLQVQCLFKLIKKQFTEQTMDGVFL